MIAPELAEAAMALLKRHYHWNKPLRSLGIRVTNLVPIGDARQVSLFTDEAKREKMERLEYAIDGVRSRFGRRSINRALLSYDTMLDAKADHTIHPVGYL